MAEQPIEQQSSESRDEQIQHIRLAVRQLCAQYGEDYWLEMDRTHGYPTEFVAELTRAGFLGVLMQELDEQTARAFGLPDQRGALIAQVLPGGPADEAGFIPGG